MGVQELVIYITAFTIGLVCGSFFNVCIYRIPLKKDIVYTPSHCPGCGHRLSFLDLIPILSFIHLRGRCRYCQKQIGIRYLAVEVVSGLAFLSVIAFRGLNIESMYLLVLISIGIIVSAIDLEKGIIPDSVILTGFVIQLSYLLCFNYDVIISSVIGALSISSILFFLDYIYSGRQNTSPGDSSGNCLVGGGDIKYIALIGFWLGFSRLVFVFLLAGLLAFIPEILRMVLYKKRYTPLTVYLTLSCFILILAGGNQYLSGLLGLFELGWGI